VTAADRQGVTVGLSRMPGPRTQGEVIPPPLSPTCPPAVRLWHPVCPVDCWRGSPPGFRRSAGGGVAHVAALALLRQFRALDAARQASRHASVGCAERAYPGPNPGGSDLCAL